MYISKFKVSNYKSYLKPPEIELKRGFNIITGQNSAGKTALLEPLTLEFAAAPHRSEVTMPQPGTPIDPTSSISLTIVTPGKELFQLMNRTATYTFPRPSPNTRDAKTGQLLTGELDEMNRLLGTMYESLDLSFEVQLDLSRGAATWKTDDSNFLGVYQTDLHSNGTTVNTFQVKLDERGVPRVVNGPNWTNRNEDVRINLAPQLRTRIYRFRAERFNPGQYDFGTSSVLLPDAANLPQVLDVLTSNPARFDRYNAVIEQILPQVCQISIHNISGNKIEILIWPSEYGSERSDLAIPLNECGSGVGQVLAILYVVMTSDYPQTIVIDEPQSFLHPGAVRKLIEVLKQHPQHQYIMATHSPTVITASEPSTLLVLRTKENETSIETIDPSNEKHMEMYLGEIGARLADVFGADNILWVEGQTEEKCFPLILRRVAHRAMMGTEIIGVRKTGDFQGGSKRDKEKILETYQTLSKAKTLLPKVIAFIFDSECLSLQEQQELRRLAPGLVHLLPHRMYENYLLDADAVAEVMNEIDGFRPNRPVSIDEVAALFSSKRDERDPRDTSGKQLKYFCKGTGVVPINWESTIDAAALLRDVFTELSETRIAYEKTKHSVAITECLIRRKPEVLNDFAEWIAGVIWPTTESNSHAIV